MKCPKISIITPSFNQGKFIKQTIDSILNQNYPNLEYWIIDGGSSDETIEILKSYGKKIKWISEKDKGQTDAINKGLKRINGDIIAFINSDDYYEKNTFNLVSNIFENNPKCNWLTGDYKIVDERGQVRRSFIPKYKNIWKILPTNISLPITNFISQPSTFWSKQAFKKIGYFNDKLKYTMDYEYWLRLMSEYKLTIVPEVLSNFRIHKNSKGESSYIQQFDEEIKSLNNLEISKLLVYLHNLSNLLIKLIYSFLK